MANSTLGNLTAATAATGGLFYGTQSNADRKFTSTAAGAAMIEAATAAAQRDLLNVAQKSGVYDNGSTGTSPLAVDASNGLAQKATITANLTVSAPSNPVAGMEMSIAITASGGARTITLGSITVPTGYTFSGVVASGSVRRLKVYYTGSAWLLTSNLEFA